MNPSLLEYFAAHEQPSDRDDLMPVPFKEALAGSPIPVGELMGTITWEATWRAKLRFIRARAMVEEAEKHRVITPESYARLAEQAIPKTTGLSFSEALVAMKEGKAVRRFEWRSLSARITTACVLEIHDQQGHLPMARINHGDLLADDWEAVP